MEHDNSRLIILASGSPRRRELLTLLGLPFEVMSSDADESTPPGMPPADIVRSLALRKAEAVLPAAGERMPLLSAATRLWCWTAKCSASRMIRLTAEPCWNCCRAGRIRYLPE